MKISTFGKMAKDGERLRARAPEVRDTDIERGRLKFVTRTSMIRLKKHGAQSVRGRDLNGARFLSSISTTASRRSVSTSGSTVIIYIHLRNETEN